MINNADEDTEENPELQLFDDLTDEQSKRLFGSAVKRSYKKLTEIYAPGDESSIIYFVLSGRIKIYDLTEDGREIIFRICGPKSWFGLSAIFGGKGRPVYAQSLVHSEVMLVERAEFEAFVHDYPDFALTVIHLLGERLRQAHAAITEFMVGDVRSRTAQLFLKLAEPSSTMRDGVVNIESRLTHQEIANMTGATRTTITKVMNDWKRRDIIRVHNGRICILNHEALVRLVRH